MSVESRYVFPTHLAYQFLKDRESQVVKANIVYGDGECALCGQRVSEGYGVGDIVSGAFTNWDRFAPWSRILCRPCAVAFKAEELRHHSFWISARDGVKFFAKQETARYLFDPPEPPFVFCVTVSHKKHMLFRTKVNYSRKSFYVQFEEQTVLFDTEALKKPFEVLQEMYLSGVDRAAIQTGEYKPKSKVQVEKLLAWDTQIERLRGRPELNLLLYALGGVLSGGKVEKEE